MLLIWTCHVTINTFKVMLTCALRAHVKEPKKSNFVLENMIF